MHNKLIRLPQVKSATGLSKSTIYARIAEGTFPKIDSHRSPPRGLGGI